MRDMMEGLLYVLQQFWGMVTPFSVFDLIDILIMVFIIYKAFMLIRRTSTGAVAKGVILLLAALVVAAILHLNTVSFLLDRLVYGLCKYYGEEKGPSLLRGRRAAILTTCGYRPEKGADLFEEGVRRYCKHTGMTYAGMLAERHLGYDVPFMDGEKEQRARAFARTLSAGL